MEFKEDDFEVWKEYLFQNSWPPWYDPDAQRGWLAESSDIVKWCTALFRENLTLLDEFPKENLDAGFWLIPSSWGFCGVTLDQDLPLAAREEMVQSMACLYEGVFRHLGGLTAARDMFLDSYFSYAVWYDRGIERESDILPALDALLTRLEGMNDAVANYAASLGRAHYQSILR